MRKRLILSGFLFAIVVNSQAQHIESEPNDSRAQANVFTLNPGEWIQGTSMGASGSELDYFLVRTAFTTPAIYRYRLVLTTTPGLEGHTAHIRGQGEVAAPPGTWPGPLGTGNGNEGFVQSSSASTIPSRFIQWYGFGQGESIYYRVTGTANTIDPYRSTLERVEITPTDVGTYLPGLITISTIGGTSLNTEIWVYDSNFNAIPGYSNDNESIDGGGTGTTNQSLLTRDYSPGVYYLAISRFNLVNEYGSPCDDRNRTGGMLFPENAGAILSSATTTTTSPIGFSMTDINGTHNFSFTGMEPYEVVWFRFEVVPEPASFLALSIGIGSLIRLVRNRKRVD